jgi:hypothetical protein
VVLEQHAPRSVARANPPWLEEVPDLTVGAVLYGKTKLVAKRVNGISPTD